MGILPDTRSYLYGLIYIEEKTAGNREIFLIDIVIELPVGKVFIIRAIIAFYFITFTSVSINYYIKIFFRRGEQIRCILMGKQFVL